MREVVIVEALRSPIGKKKGALSSAHPTEMLAQVMAAILKRAKVATGWGLVTKAVNELERAAGRRAIITMCCGGGLGTGTLIERV